MFYRRTDTEAPNIKCPSDCSTSTDDEKSTAIVLWKHPNATDNSGHVKELACSSDAGRSFPIGETEVTCRAVDNSGNIALCYFYIDVTGMCKLPGGATIGRWYVDVPRS